MEARRPRLLEFGLFLVIVAVPLAFTPFSASPFGDPKLFLLTGGTMLIWLGGVPVDRRLGLLAGLWVLATVVATALGVDPLTGITASTSGGGGGILLTTCAAVLLVAGAGIPSALAARARGWFAWTGTAVAVLLLVYRLSPDTLESLLPRLSFIGVTLGNQLFASAFVAAAMATAVAGLDPSRRARSLAQLTVMTLGVAAVGERSALILPLVAIAVASWRAHIGIRDVLVVVAIFLVGFFGWQLADPLLPGKEPPGSTIQQFGSAATDEDRLVVWRVSLRAALERPVLGWGGATTHAAFLHEATVDEIAAVTRAWRDAHDLFLETWVSSGLVGLVALIALLGLAVARALRSPPEAAWAVGAAAALGAYALVEPLNLVLTPLVFLCAGIAAGSAKEPVAGGAAGRTPSTAGPRTAVAIVTAGLSVAVVLAGLQFAAAVFEQRGRDYGDIAALRTAITLAPWQLSAREELGRQLAVEGSAGFRHSGDEAQSIMAAAVAAHPWDADVRPVAAEVATIDDRSSLARGFLVQQLERFPGDVAFVEAHVNAPPVAGSG